MCIHTYTDIRIIWYICLIHMYIYICVFQYTHMSLRQNTLYNPMPCMDESRGSYCFTVFWRNLQNQVSFHKLGTKQKPNDYAIRLKNYGLCAHSPRLAHPLGCSLSSLLQLAQPSCPVTFRSGQSLANASLGYRSGYRFSVASGIALMCIRTPTISAAFE